MVSSPTGKSNKTDGDHAAERLAPVITPPMINRSNPHGSIARFVILALTLVAIVIIAVVWRNEQFADPLVLSILGGLAGIGVFFLFSLALGFIHLSYAKRNEDFSASLVDGMENGLVAVDTGGRIVYSNRAYSKMIGATEESEIASVEALFSRRTESANVVYRMANAARTGEAVSEEFRLSGGLRSSEEGARWFRLRAGPMRAEGFDKPLTLWEVADVTTDRRRHESAFQQLQNAIDYLDHAPVGFFASDERDAVVYINATLADWLGVDLARFEPGSVKLKELVVGDGLALLRAARPASSSRKTAIVDLDLTRSDGKRLPVRLYHRAAYASDAAPGASRTIVINRMANENGEAEAEMRFTRFFNETPFAIAVIAADGSLLSTNAPFQRLFSMLAESRDVGATLHLTDLAPEVHSAILEDRWRQVLEKAGRIEPVELPMPIEKNRFIRIFLSPINEREDASGTDPRAECAIAYVIETTEQRALEEQFAQGQKMQAVGQLAGGVAHDFNNVLTAIIGFSDLLLANHRPSDPSFQDIMNIKQNANRAASLVRQLLAFSRRQTLRPQVLNLSDVLSDLRMLLDRLLGEKVSLNVIHGRDVWPVLADVSQFEQVIINLAVNARDAMPEGGKLLVRTTNLPADEVRPRFTYKEMPSADFVLIEVEDTGTGMPPEVMEKIFEPFFSTKDVGKGTGLGLSTVYGIVKQTGGFIYPESTPGRGTVFRVFLPRHREEEVKEEISGEFDESGQKIAKAAAPAPIVEEKRDLTGNACILLVEDEDAVRAFATRALASRGYEVHEASNGAEALELFADIADKVDLVVSDVVMPEMDGPTLFRHLREKRPELRFIFMSGYAEEAFAKNLPDSEREKFGFLPKPFSLKQLVTTVKEVIGEGSE